MFTLPWLVLAASRVSGRPVSPASALAAGLLTGVGIALKPHFLAVVLMVELFVLIRHRSLRICFRPETVGIVIAGGVYLACVWLFARPYLSEVLPQVAATYWGFNAPLDAVIKARREIVALAFAALVLARLKGFEPVPTIFALAALGFLVAALMQSKGYSYHFFPVLAFALLSLVTLSWRDRVGWIAAVVAGLSLAFFANVATMFLQHRSLGGAYGERTSCLIGMVQTYVAGDGGFLALSTHPYPGFPVANYAGRAWLADTNSRIYIPAIVHLRAETAPDAQMTQVLARAEAAERQQIAGEMARAPGLVLVDAQPVRHGIGGEPFDFVGFYLEDPEFQRLWSGYEEVSSCTQDYRAFAPKALS